MIHLVLQMHPIMDDVCSYNKIDSMLREPNCPFVLYVGTKRLVKRKEFEVFLSEKLVI